MTDPNSSNSSNGSLATLEARVREAREAAKTRFSFTGDGATMFWPHNDALDALIAAAEALGAAKERGRCREAATLCCHVVAVPLAAIDAVETP